MRIGVDLMGSDHPPSVLFTAVSKASKALGPSYSLIVIALQDTIKKISDSAVSCSPQIEWVLAEEVIEMADAPLFAVRHKKNASMLVGLRLLKKKQIDAFISSGNTGALVAASSLILSKTPGTKRPALLATLPTKEGNVAILDVGGNVSCKAADLVQFAHLGADYQRNFRGVKTPRVGLLNIGVESKKGRSEVRQAYEILVQQMEKKSCPPIQFVGNVEGRDIFQGKIDVLVTDGFTGNILLKTAEGLAVFLMEYLNQLCTDKISDEFKLINKEMQTRFNYTGYPGAVLCGVEGLVVKCHGDSSEQAMYHAILGVANHHLIEF